MKRDVFTYKDDMIDLNKVTAIHFEGTEVTFCMDFTDNQLMIEIDKADVDFIKKSLAQQFTQNDPNERPVFIKD